MNSIQKFKRNIYNICIYPFEILTSTPTFIPTFFPSPPYLLPIFFPIFFHPLLTLSTPVSSFHPHSPPPSSRFSPTFFSLINSIGMYSTGIYKCV